MKTLRRVGSVIFAVIIVLAIALVVVNFLVTHNRSLPGGYRPYVVVSGSMVPKMPVGSMILSKPVPPASIKAGEIITFLHQNEVVTHRVAAVNSDGSFSTKGDANNAQDLGTTPPGDVIGRVVMVVPYVGRLSGFVHSPLGLFLMILLPGAILIVWEVFDLFHKKKKPIDAQLTKALVLALCLVGAGGQVAVASAGPVNTTLAYFATSGEPAVISVTAGTWEQPDPTSSLLLQPGDAKAVRHDRYPASAPIASPDAGSNLKLDFGEVNPGTSNNSPDVFRIKNLGAKEFLVDIIPGGGFEDFVGRIRLGNETLPALLSSGNERSVAIKLDVPKDAAPGDYSGTIRVSAADGSFSADIPALVTVAEKGGKKGNSADAPGSPQVGSQPDSTGLNPSAGNPPTDDTLVPPAEDPAPGGGSVLPEANPRSEQDLVLSAGYSKAAWPSTRPAGPARLPIASAGGSGTLSLDFGELAPGDRSKSPDVFRIHNLGAMDVQVDIIPRGEFKDFVRRVRLGDRRLPALLMPGDERSVEIDLAIPEDAHPGDYEGTIRVSSADGAISVDIPVLLSVSEKDDPVVADPAESPQAEPDPGPGGSSPPQELVAPAGDTGSSGDGPAVSGDTGPTVENPAPDTGSGSAGHDPAPAAGTGAGEQPPPPVSTPSG